jgi:protocatechuate 3,4-dioxygenase alpha subunit
MSKETPSQTVGPYFAIGLYSDDPAYPRIVTGTMTTAEVEGERIRLEGTVLDGAGDVVPDCVIEIWQADGDGRYRTAEFRGNDGFTGFGRVGPDEAGRLTIETIKPGRVPGLGGGAPQAPHLTVVIFSRGLLTHAYTRLYFDDEAEANAADAVLSRVPEARRKTLLAQKAGHGLYRFTIRLQGDDETVFFEV